MTKLLSSLIPATGTNALFVVYKTANHTALPGQRVLVGTDSGVITILLPANPATGVAVSVWDADNNAGVNNITIGRNGQTIDGAAADDTLDVSGGHLEYVFDGTTWKRAFWAPGGMNQSEVDTRIDVKRPLAGTGYPLVWTPDQIADDGVVSFDFGSDVYSGQMILSHNQSGLNNHGIFAIRAASSSAFVKSISSTGISATTGVLTGTTGSDGTVTVSTHTDRKLYIENRNGSASLFTVAMFIRFIPTTI